MTPYSWKVIVMSNYPFYAEVVELFIPLVTIPMYDRHFTFHHHHLPRDGISYSITTSAIVIGSYVTVFIILLSCRYFLQ
jgi:hypothetical protein